MVDHPRYYYEQQEHHPRYEESDFEGAVAAPLEAPDSAPRTAKQLAGFVVHRAAKRTRVSMRCRATFIGLMRKTNDWKRKDAERDYNRSSRSRRIRDWRRLTGNF